MDRPRRVWSAEPLAVTLIFICVVATLATVITVHRRRPASQTGPVVVTPAAPVVKVVETPAPKPLPNPPPPRPAPAPLPEDPTKAIVAELARAEAEQRLETVRAMRQIAALDAATRAAQADSERWKRGLTLTHAQLDARAAEALRRESQADMAIMERDALARRRDGLKATLERDRERPSYAVLPHKGPNGTWQRPIVLECKDESVTLRPNGPTFGLIDLISPFGTRNSPFVAMISREAIRIQRQAGPDGADIIPYIFFIIRPDGVRAYYEARTRLERLGIAFGYELADADWAIDVPDLDQPSTWDGSPPASTSGNESLTADLTGPHGDVLGGGVGGGRASREEIANAFTWPKGPAGLDGGQGGQEGSIVAFGDPLAGNRATRGGNGGGLMEEAWNRTLAMSGSPPRPGGLANGLNGEGEGEVAGNGTLTGSDRLDQGVGHGPSRSGLKPGLGGRSAGGRGMGEEIGNRTLAMSGSQRPNGLPDGPNGEGEVANDSTTGLRPAVEGRRTGLVAGHEVGDMPHSLGSSDTIDGGRGSGEFQGGQGSVSGGSVDRRGVAAGGTGSDGANAVGPGDWSHAPGQGPRSGSGDQGISSASEHGLANRGTGSGTRSSGASSSPGHGGDSSNSGSPGMNAGGAGGTPSRFGSSSRPAHSLELVVSCGPKGVAVHPGNYRVTMASLKSKDALLVGQLRAIVAHREQAEPDTTIVPSLRYVIEAGGHQTYATAKAQVMFAGIDWPSSLQVSGGDTLRLFSTDSWQ